MTQPAPSPGNRIVDDIRDEIRQRKPRREGDEVRFLCPAHNDHRPSARWNNKKETWYCDACGAGGGWMNLAEQFGIEVPKRCTTQPTQPEQPKKERAHLPPGPARTTAQVGLTLKEYAEKKQVPIDFLERYGVSQVVRKGVQALRLVCKGRNGEEVGVRYRLAMEGPNRFRWRHRSKVVPYGLWHLDKAVKKGWLVLVEGESDCHTGWFHGVPTLGLPGATTWKDEWAAHFEGIKRIFLPIEPDNGGEKMFRTLAKSPLADRIHIIDLGEFKDLSELHLSGKFKELWGGILQNSTSLEERLAAQRETERDDAWLICKELAKSSDILDQFAVNLKRHGVVGETRTATILFLIIISRFLDRPVSVVVKGPSSAGKSYVTERVLAFFPETAFYALSAMSERALAYSQEPLKHRFLVIYEAAGLSSDFATYLLRSLLSEGRVRYETVEKGEGGLQPRFIEREGPTGLIVTTTQIKLHPENETRMFSITVTDTRDQTKAIFYAIASEDERDVDFTTWHALQDWLWHSEHRVTIPYSSALADLIPPIAVRMRRDFGALLALVKAHAILHQAQRPKDSDGRIIASLDDYSVVRDLVAELMSEGVNATVSGTERQTVEVVAELGETHPDGVSMTALAKRLDIEPSSASRRARAAMSKDYLKNLEEKRGKPARLVIGTVPLPENQVILPSPDEVRVRCTTDPEIIFDDESEEIAV